MDISFSALKFRSHQVGKAVEMSAIHNRTVDPELRNLIVEALDAGLLKPRSEDARVASIVAEKGQGHLSAEERGIWEARVLPVLSKPISQQLAIGAIQRRGGRLGRREAFAVDR